VQNIAHPRIFKEWDLRNAEMKMSFISRKAGKGDHPASNKTEYETDSRSFQATGSVYGTDLLSDPGT